MNQSDQREGDGVPPEEQQFFKPEDDAAKADESTLEAVAPAEPEAQRESVPEPIAKPSKRPRPEQAPITWTASEFIAHNKSFGWYALLLLVGAVLSAGVWFVTKDMFATAVVGVGIVLFAAYGARKPREITYTLDNSGLAVGNHHYTYREFRSFTVIPEGAFSSVEFMPLKRFAMYTSIYYEPADEEKIVNFLSAYLPLEERSKDPIEQLMHRIRF